MSTPPSFEVQAQSLATLFTGAAHTACEFVANGKGPFPGFFTGPVEIERTEQAAFTITTPSGTVLPRHRAR